MANKPKDDRPKYKYKNAKSVGFINPYTFVQLPSNTNQSGNKTENAENYYKGKELRTGVLRCSLQVRTPLAMPDLERACPDKEKKDHWRYPFYKIGDNYAIPGSSIRGMLRSVYETITDSCFSTIKDEQMLSLRIPVKMGYNAGILIQEGETLRLYNAERYLVPVERKCGYAPLDELEGKPLFTVKNENGIRWICANGKKWKTGDKVCFRSVPSNHEKKIRGNVVMDKVWDGLVKKIGDGNEEGYVYVGEIIKNKHGESIFKRGKEVEIKGTEEEKNEILRKAYKRLKETLPVYRNKSINRNLSENDAKKKHYGYQGIENLDVKTGIPLWYECKNGKVHFSYAAIGRTMYDRNLNDLIGKGRDRCGDRGKPLCEACLLFGMAGASAEEAGMGSRVRVTDAVVDRLPKSELPMETLKELGTPRYSYLPFYARKVDNEKKKDTIPESYDDSDVEISGRKYYWHNKKVNELGGDSIYRTGEKTERNATIELVKPDAGMGFHFDIYYDGITNEQLEKLLWTVTLGENDPNSNLCHKLGHGKPLGLGSVKITVTQRQERTVEGEKGYFLRIFPVEDKSIPTGCNEKIACAVKKVLDMEEPFRSELNKDLPIEYPNVVDKDENAYPVTMQSKNNNIARHQWYSRNRSSKTGQVLPKLLDEKQKLFAICCIEESERGAELGKTSEEGKITETPGAKEPFQKREKYKAIVTGFNETNTVAYIYIKEKKASGSIYCKDIGVGFGKVNEQMFPLKEPIYVEFLRTTKGKDKPRYNFRPVDKDD